MILSFEGMNFVSDPIGYDKNIIYKKEIQVMDKTKIQYLIPVKPIHNLLFNKYKIAEKIIKILEIEIKNR
jgi:hypothetical protein